MIPFCQALRAFSATVGGGPILDDAVSLREGGGSGGGSLHVRPRSRTRCSYSFRWRNRDQPVRTIANRASPGGPSSARLPQDPTDPGGNGGGSGTSLRKGGLLRTVDGSTTGGSKGTAVLPRTAAPSSGA